MKGNSILLALSGSQQSRYATDVAWRLSEQLGAKITAHHVIDTHNAWQFIGQDKPGFLDSETYVSAYQTVCKTMFILSEGLAESYASEAVKTGVDDICIVTEGNPQEEICRNAENHNLIIIGHKPTLPAATSSTKYSEFIRLSLAESLALNSPRPLLVVQGPCKIWSSLAIVISMEHINEKYLNSCLDLADALNLPPLLVVIECGGNEEDLTEFVRDLRTANERLSRVPITFSSVDQDIALSTNDWFLAAEQENPAPLLENALLVMPTRHIGTDRLTVLSSSAATFVRFLNLPSILLWPEEYTHAFNKNKKGKSASAAYI